MRDSWRTARSHPPSIPPCTTTGISHHVHHLSLQVHPKYKEPLAEDFKPRLGVFLDKLSEDEKGTLISVMSDWVSSRLDGNMSATGAIVDFLGYEVYDDNYLNQLSWFGLFPEDIPMAAFCDVFKALQEAG